MDQTGEFAASLLIVRQTANRKGFYKEIKEISGAGEWCRN